MQVSHVEFLSNDSDYTSPNFLENLLKKIDQTTQANNSIRNIEENLQLKSKQNSPFMMRSTKKSETVKVIGQKTNMSKQAEVNIFSLFFKKVLIEFKSSQQVNQLWNGFEEVMHSEQQVHLYINELKKSRRLDNSPKKSEQIQNSMTQSSSKLSQVNSTKTNKLKNKSKTPCKTNICKQLSRKYSQSVMKCDRFYKNKLRKSIQLQSRIITSNLVLGEQQIKQR